MCMYVYEYICVGTHVHTCWFRLLFKRGIAPRGTSIRKALRGCSGSAYLPLGFAWAFASACRWLPAAPGGRAAAAPPPKSRGLPRGRGVRFLARNRGSTRNFARYGPLRAIARASRALRALRASRFARLINGFSNHWMDCMFKWY